MNHKRKRTKNQRAGCVMCKPHKNNAWKGAENSQTIQERKAIETDRMVEDGRADDDSNEWWLW